MKHAKENEKNSSIKETRNTKLVLFLAKLLILFNVLSLVGHTFQKFIPKIFYSLLGVIFSSTNTGIFMQIIFPLLKIKSSIGISLASAIIILVCIGMLKSSKIAVKSFVLISFLNLVLSFVLYWSIRFNVNLDLTTWWMNNFLGIIFLFTASYWYMTLASKGVPEKSEEWTRFIFVRIFLCIVISCLAWVYLSREADRQNRISRWEANLNYKLRNNLPEPTLNGKN